MIDPMWPTDNVHQWRETVGSPPLPTGPAMTTLRSVIAPLASTIRSAGIVYVVAQLVIWHSFYTADAWRLTAPVIAVAWAAAVIVCLRRRSPSPFLVCVDSCFYVALALSAQQCVPPSIRDDTFSWVVISMSGQLIIPAWYAPGSLAVLLTLVAPAAYLLGDVMQPVTNTRTLAGAAMVLIVVGLVHNFAGGSSTAGPRRPMPPWTRPLRPPASSTRSWPGTSSVASMSACCTTRSSTRSPHWPGAAPMTRPGR